MAKRYTEEFKQEMINLYKNGHPASQICREFGMSKSTLFLWIKNYTADKHGQIPREIYLQQLEMERLRKENLIFKVTGCTPASPLRDKLNAIDKHKDEFSIYRLCKTLDVLKSTYYHHAFRSPEKKQNQLVDDELKKHIPEIFNKSKGTFGARRIRVKLQEKGFVVSQEKVSRLMKELGLSSSVPRLKENSANDRQYKYYPNKLKRNFSAEYPNQIWVSDITYARIGSRFMFLCVIIDLFSRKVVGYNISEDINTKLTLTTFESAFINRGKPKDLMFHSDQGCQYTSYMFRSFLRENKVKQSFSAPGSPLDNAVAESFFSSIKKEDFRRNFYTSHKEFQEAVDEYINFYNDYRPHQRLKYLTPNQVEDAYYNSSAS